MRAIIILLGMQLLALGAENKSASPESIAAGKKLFASSCSVGYCHGAEGRAGRGPRLRDREWDRNYLFKVIDEGIPNSSMPAWHAKFSSDQINSIVAYILSIAREAPAAGSPERAPANDRPVDAPAAAVTSLTGNIAAGKTLFYDATNDRNCGVCHESGPDLAEFSHATPRELLQRILLPVNSKKTVEIVTNDGEKLHGIIVEENPARLRLLDLTEAGLPVTRTLQASQIAQRRAIDAKFVHDNFAATYTMRQLLDLIAFIKSGPGGPRVQLRDLF